MLANATQRAQESHFPMLAVRVAMLGELKLSHMRLASAWMELQLDHATDAGNGDRRTSAARRAPATATATTGLLSRD